MTLFDGSTTGSRASLERKFSKIEDNFRTIEEVTEALDRAGLESSNIIVGIDFTKSNDWTGANSFQGRSLHDIGEGLNPYEHAISIIGRTLSKFDKSNLIPCFGFGDETTQDEAVFGFYPDDGQACIGFDEVLTRYRELVPQLRLAGPTSFAPIIEQATTIVDQSGGQFHVLLIIADGQVTRSVDIEFEQLSPQERETIDAIVIASEYPLSIVLVGVGDGPWDMMKEFDDNIPARAFDNFQFVNFTEIMSKNIDLPRKEAEFALSALMEIPSQYKATLELCLLGTCTGKTIHMFPLPPPSYGSASVAYDDVESRSPSIAYDDVEPSSPSVAYDVVEPARQTESSSDDHVCAICLSNPKDMAFGCGHQTCCECGQELQACPLCRKPIEMRLKLY